MITGRILGESREAGELAALRLENVRLRIRILRARRLLPASARREATEGEQGLLRRAERIRNQEGLIWDEVEQVMETNQDDERARRRLEHSIFMNRWAFRDVAVQLGDPEWHLREQPGASTPSTSGENRHSSSGGLHATSGEARQCERCQERLARNERNVVSLNWLFFFRVKSRSCESRGFYIGSGGGNQWYWGYYDFLPG